MFVTLIIASALFTAQQTSASAAPTTQSPPSTVLPQTTTDLPAQSSAPAAAPQRRQMVCENRALTGRRLERRICYTPEQYAEMIAVKRKQAEEMVAGTHVQDDRAVLGGDGPL
ncbi:hypothetical protein [Brevundimonas sp.]|uniref:hypothetical protein n=1 Tax=Brevundimonas sp. TaxID=1871086 RepID=UPI0025BC4AAF|nr:hypothetical protein [Brevundimonas sp.]